METETTRPAAATASDDSPADAGDSLACAVEALLFSSEIPLTTERLASLTGAVKRDLLAAVDHLNVFYAETGRVFRISSLAGGFQLVTLPEHAELLSRLHKDGVPTRLSRAALETLAIVAFKQPVTRGEVDQLRGVTGSDGVLRNLLERKLVRIAGRAQVPGRPLLYATTKEFLSYFGLAALDDLPRTAEIEALLAGVDADAPAPEQSAPPATPAARSDEESDPREGTSEA
jgi:segregation and condensation protein B